jgi:hypothetical protein
MLTLRMLPKEFNPAKLEFGPSDLRLISLKRYVMPGYPRTIWGGDRKIRVRVPTGYGATLTARVIPT